MLGGLVRSIQPASGGGGGGGISLSQGAAGVVVVPTQPATFSITGLNSGADFPANSVVVVGFFNTDGSGGINTPLIGGQAATLLVNDAGTGRLFVYSTLVGGSTIPDTFGGLNGNFYTNLIVRAWIFGGATNATPSVVTGATVTGGVDPQTLSGGAITVPVGGAAAVIFGCANPVSGTTTQWGLPSGSDAADGFATSGTSYLVSTYHTSVAGSFNPGVTGVTNALDFRNNNIAAVAYP